MLFFILYLLNVMCFSLCIAMQDNSVLEKIQDIATNLKNPYSSIEKDFAVGHLLTHNKCLDRGMFQLYVYEKYISKNYTLEEEDKIHSYFLYRITKYVLKAVQSIEQCPTSGNTIISQIKDQLYKCYQDVLWFNENNHKKLLTPLFIFNYTFKCGFFLDVINKKDFYYADMNSSLLAEILEDHIFNTIGSKYTQENIDILNKNPNLFLKKNFMFRNANIDFDALKIASNNEQYILPILNKDGIIGINTLIWCMAKKYCVIGMGLGPSHSHNDYIQTITDSAFHDFLHYRLQMRNAEIMVSRKNNLFNNAHSLVLKFITEYKNAVFLHNKADQDKTFKKIVSLFMVTHEIGSTIMNSNPQYIDPISTKLKEYLSYKTPKNPAVLDLTMPNEKLEKIFFRMSDFFILFKDIYPHLSGVANQHLLKLKNNAMRSTGKKGITYRQMVIIRNYIIYYIADAWTSFVDMYEQEYTEQLFFGKDNLPILAEELNIVTQ